MCSQGQEGWMHQRLAAVDPKMISSFVPVFSKKAALQCFPGPSGGMSC